MEEFSTTNPENAQDEILYLPTKAIIGSESFKKVSSLGKAYGRNVIIIASKFLTENTTLVQKLNDALDTNNFNVLIFANIDDYSNTDTIDSIASLVLSSATNFVVGFGDEIVLNAAKLSALMAANGLETEKFLQLQLANKSLSIHPPLPTIMIPTLYTTLSEANDYYCVRLAQANIRTTMQYEAHHPNICLLDYQLTYALPYNQMKISAFSLITYVVQSLINHVPKQHHKIFLDEIINIVNKNFPKLLEDPHNHAIRKGLVSSFSLFVLC